jgi:hypothetical protein
MPTDKQREEIIKKNTRNSKKELKRITTDRRNVIKGLIISATSEPNFMASATARNKLYGELHGQYKRLNSDLNDWTMRNGTISAKDARKFAIADMPRGTKVGTFGQFSDKHLQDIIGQINPSTVDKQVAINSKIGGMYDRDIRIFRQTVSNVNAVGAVEGLTTAEMTAMMQKDIKGKAGNLQFIDRAGRTWSAETYFSMLNQTMHQAISRESYNATVTDAGYDLVVIGGGVTGSSAKYPSDPCDDWAGKVISLTGATSGFPTMQDAMDAGVFHPRCVHFTRVLTPSERKELTGG